MIEKPPKIFKRKSGEEYLSEEEIARFQEAFDAARKKPTEAVVSGVTFEKLPAPAQKEVVQLEREMNKELDDAQEASAKEQLGLVRRSINQVLSFFDLETKEKAMEALIEIVPYVGAVYAVTGRKIEIREGRPHIGRISWTERGLYLAGELLLSGHLLVGVKRTIVKQGLKVATKEAAKIGMQRTGQLLIRRSQERLLNNERL